MARMAAVWLGFMTLVSACGATTRQAAPGTIAVVAAENEYGNVAAQIGGKDVSVISVESNPNTDPHSYEVSPSVAEEVAGAQLVIQNGVGYDDFMTRIESASPSQSRKVINVQHLLGLPDSTPNPHLWYDPTTMPKVANALAADYAALKPADAAYFMDNATTFIASLNQWLQAIADFKSQHAGTPVATTEPVADYMLEAAGADNLTPFRFQADIMNGVDPSPQDVSLQDESVHRAQGQGVRLQPAGDRCADADLHQRSAVREYPGDRRVRNDANPGLHLPVVDARRGDRAAEGGRRRYLDTKPVVAVQERAANGSDEILAVDGVSVTLSGREILRDVTFHINAGEFTGLIGSNGAGKTTLLRVILGLIAPSAGTVRVESGSRRQPLIGYVPQRITLDPDMPLRARDLVALGIDGQRFGLPLPSAARRRQVDEMLEAVDAVRFADSRVGNLSGGEQQRVLIAHALISHPRLLLLDEPLANLDIASEQEIVDLVARVAREQRIAVLISTHDMNPLLPVMDRIVYIANGRIATGTTAEVVTSESLTKLYGVHVDVIHVHDRILVVAGRREEALQHGDTASIVELV